MCLLTRNETESEVRPIIDRMLRWSNTLVKKRTCMTTFIDHLSMKVKKNICEMISRTQVNLKYNFQKL